MADYITPEQVAAASAITTTDTATLQLACSAASRLVDDFCGRRFFADTVATARYFCERDWWCVPLQDERGVSDAITVTAVATDDAGDGNYSTVWDASDWYATPINGFGPNGQSGWPYNAIVSTGARYFTGNLVNFRPYVKVTAKWGWTAVPDDVTQATLFLASEMFKAREAPFGSAGIGEFAVTIRGNRRITDLLAPYRSPTSDGKFLIA